MDTTGCISNETWMAYANGTLTEGKRAAVAAHVAGCEICVEIKEGIDCMPQPTLLSQRLENIEAEVNARVQEKRKSFAWGWALGVAAILLGTITLGWLLLVGNKDEMAMKREVTRQEFEHPSAVGVERANAPAQDHTTTTDARPVVKGNGSRPATIRKSGTPEAAQEDAFIEKEELPARLQTAITAEETKALISKDAKADAEVMEQKQKEVALGRTMEQESAKKGKQAVFKRETYPSAYGNNMNNALENNVSNNNGYIVPAFDSIQFGKAHRAFNDQKFDSCELYLLPLIQTPGGPFYEDALILRARCFIAQNKKTKARKDLNDVIKAGGRKVEAARQLLDSIR